MQLDTGLKVEVVCLKNIINNFGQKAGKIWTTLNDNGPLSEDVLIKKTKLKSNDFHAGVGWLARENKICKYGIFYKLENTNLSNSIGENAGKVWRLLNSAGQVDISSIADIANISINDAYSALGWLAREDKIKTIGSSKELKFKLKN